MGTGHSEDVEAYVLSSKYRSAVLEVLTERERATPTEIAEAADEPRPHISRALSELRDREIVELRVSDTRQVGRYYALTDEGSAVWSGLKAEIRDLDWDIREPSGPGMEAVLEAVTAELGDRVRFVGHYDGESATIFHADPSVREQYTAADIEQALHTFIFDHALDDLDVPDRKCTSEVANFDEIVLLKVRVGDGELIGISLDRTGDIPVPEFLDTIVTVYEENRAT